MGFKCGIVGLPNVGKSTLFNALTQSAAAEAANFPFCTIEPNIGDVPVPDLRLDQLAEIAGSKERLPARMTFVDIAGLVEGASKGEGLGNKFLANIREVDAILYVLRCFVDENITHVAGKVDPINDADVVETELMLADMESLQKRRGGLEKRAKGQDKEAQQIIELIDRALALLEDGKPARMLKVDEAQEKAFKELQLLTSKPVLYVANVDEESALSGNEFSNQVKECAEKEGAAFTIISAGIEAELSSLEPDERNEYLSDLGFKEPGLNRLIREGYNLLGLQTYFTAGPKEARAWTIERGITAPKAAGVIHTDFEKGFIRAETISFDDYVTLGGEVPAKEAGKMRLEGKDYIVQDGDIMMFRFNN